MRIGFVGAGRMGRPMVTRLVQAGHHVVHTTANPLTIEAIAASPTNSAPGSVYWTSR